MHPPGRRRTLAVAMAVVALAATGCGDGDDGSADTRSATTVSSDPTTAPPEDEPDTADPAGGPDPSTPPDETAAPPPTTAPPDTGALDVAPPGSVPPSAGSSDPLFVEGDVVPGLQPFVDLAVADLAARLDVATNDIGLHASVLVIWPDAGLGCPAPDVVFAQVTTDGSVVELVHDGVYYAYRSGGTVPPFLCAQALEEPPARTDGGDGDR